MEIDDDDCLILQDESEGEFGFKVKTEPGKTVEELCQEIDDFVGNTVEPEPAESKPAESKPAESKPAESKPVESEQKTKYGFKVKKRIQAPVPIMTSAVVMPPVMAPPVISYMVSTRPTVPPVRSSTATSSTPMDTMPADSTRSNSFLDARQLIKSKLNDNLRSRLGPPIAPEDVPVRSRLGPQTSSTVRSRPHQSRSPPRSRSPIRSSSSGSVGFTHQQAKRPRGPDNRNKRDQAELESVIKNLKHIPRQEKFPIRKPYQWIPRPEPEEDEEDESFSEASFTRFEEDRYVRADASWKKIFHTDTTAREYSEWFISERTPILTPALSLADAQRQIDLRYFVGPKVRQQVHHFYEHSHVDADDERVTKFVQEIKESGFMSFDTEGDGKLPSAPIHPRWDHRLFVALASPRTATVMFFHDARDIPGPLLELLSDYAIAKIQSGIGGDVELMRAAGIDVRGCVDSGTIYLLLKPGPVESGFGAKHQVKAIWEDVDCHVPYYWKTFGPAFKTQRLTDTATRHVVQDVLTPFALLFAAAIKRALQDHVDDRDIMPLVQEALELTYTKEPHDVRKQMDGRSSREYWIPPVHGSEFSLNSKGEMTMIRRARGHFVERFKGPSLADRERSAARIWRDREIPCGRHIAFKNSNWCIRLSQWCQNCGAQDHTTQQCPNWMVPCPMTHYQQIPHPPHSVLMCPQLHSFCHICKLRGHMEQIHPDVKLTPREFRQDFMQHCHEGLYTSLPYLYESNGPIRNFHWKATLFGCKMTRGQADLWLYRGLDYKLPQEMIDSRRAKQDVVRENIDSTRDTYKVIKF